MLLENINLLWVIVAIAVAILLFAKPVLRCLFKMLLDNSQRHQLKGRSLRREKLSSRRKPERQ